MIGDGTSNSSGQTGSVSLSTGGGKNATPLFLRLTLMMLLEFVVFGSWYSTLGLVLATKNLAPIIGAAYSLGAVAAIISPLFLGALGDRFLAAQKLLGIAHLAGGVVMLGLPAAVNAGHANLTLALIFVYMLCFIPTLGLANSLAFRQLGDDQRLFPYIRVFGTVGWVVAGLLVGALHLSASTGIFTTAAIASFGLGIYSFTLPSTPPTVNAKFSIGDIIGAKAFVLFRQRNFTVLIVCALLTSISLGVYNSYTSPYLGKLGFTNVAGLLAIGQASEVAFIVIIPFVLRTIGMKWSLLGGMGMWGVRFILFILAAHGQPWLAVVGVALQGICNDFFLILSAMYIDRIAPDALKAQAQSWLILVISGFGSGIGSLVSGYLYGRSVGLHPFATAASWTPMWLLPIGVAAITAVLWVTLFRYSPMQGMTSSELAGPGYHSEFDPRSNPPH
jgi:nucleoside transporter